MKRISNFKFQISPASPSEAGWANFGFTLIELLISIFIITLLLGASFAGYARLNQRQTLISAGQNLKNILRDAQNRAVSRELDCGPLKCDCTPGADTGFSGWYVDFLAPTPKIYAKCGSYQFGDKAFGLVAEIGISPYITPPASPLIFKNNPPSSTSHGTICVSHSHISSTYYVIRVKETGAISDDGGLVGTCP